DHSWNTESIFRVVPAERHHNVGPTISLDSGFVQHECAFHRLPCKNYTGKIRLLQEFNEATDELLVVSDDIEKNAATVGGQHDVSRFWLVVKFGLIAYAASAPVAVLCYS